MKVFQTIQKQYAILGINSSNQFTLQLPISKRVFFGFSSFFYGIGSQFVYIYFVANGFMEYMDCICSISAAVIMCVCMAAVVFRKAILFECIDDIEKLINTSE